MLNLRVFYLYYLCSQKLIVQLFSGALNIENGLLDRNH